MQPQMNPRRWARPIVVRARHIGLTDRDVIVGGYPRSGTTWLRFMLAEVLTGEPAGFASIAQVIPPVGHHRRATASLPDGGRLTRTHEPYRDVYRRGVYIVRDVRSVVVSYRNYINRVDGETRDPDAFVEDFVAGNLDGYGPWHRHVRSWVDGLAGPGRTGAVVRYEDLKKDPGGELARICDLLGIPVSHSRLLTAVDHNDLEHMRAREQAEEGFFADGRARDLSIPFVRTGSTTEWAAVLSEAQLDGLEPCEPVLRELGYPSLHERPVETERAGDPVRWR